MTAGKKGSAQHGTYSKYVLGCKCPECMAAMSKYRRELRESQKRRFAAGVMKTTVKHGTALCRTMFDCTRPECIEARKQYDREYNLKNADKLRARRREKYLQEKLKGVQHGTEATDQVPEPTPVQP